MAKASADRSQALALYTLKCLTRCQGAINVQRYFLTSCGEVHEQGSHLSGYCDCLRSYREQTRGRPDALLALSAHTQPAPRAAGVMGRGADNSVSQAPCCQGLRCPLRFGRCNAGGGHFCFAVARSGRNRSSLLWPDFTPLSSDQLRKCGATMILVAVS